MNGYPIDLLYENLGRMTEAASIRVFLDACFSGDSQAGMLIRSASPMFVSASLPDLSGKAMAVLTAASGDEVASWDERAEHGMFTHHLLDALYGCGRCGPRRSGDGGGDQALSGPAPDPGGAAGVPARPDGGCRRGPHDGAGVRARRLVPEAAGGWPAGAARAAVHGPDRAGGRAGADPEHSGALRARDGVAGGRVPCGSEPSRATRRWWRSFDHGSEGATEHRIALRRSAQPFTVVTEPADARVRFLSIEERYRPGMELAAGEYRVEASLEGYETIVEIVRHGSAGATQAPDCIAAAVDARPALPGLSGLPGDGGDSGREVSHGLPERRRTLLWR